MDPLPIVETDEDVVLNRRQRENQLKQERVRYTIRAMHLQEMHETIVEDVSTRTRRVFTHRLCQCA